MLSEVFKEWLGDPEQDLSFYPDVVAYTHKFDQILNYCLRHNYMTNVAKNMINYMADLLDQSNPIPEDICLYRGISSGDFMQQLLSLDVGSQYLMHGFNSVTPYQETAKQFSGDAGLIMQLCFPKGSKLLHLTEVSRYSESELLGRPDLKVELISKYPEYKFMVLNAAEQYEYTEPVDHNFDINFSSFMRKIIEINSDDFDDVVDEVRNWPDSYLNALEDREEYQATTILPRTITDQYQLVNYMMHDLHEYCEHFPGSLTDFLQINFGVTNINDVDFDFYSGKEDPNFFPHGYFDVEPC